MAFTDVSSATSRLGSRHSQWSCGAKMLRIIISMASAIWEKRDAQFLRVYTMSVFGLAHLQYGAGLTQDRPVRMESFNWNVPKPMASTASSTIKVSNGMSHVNIFTLECFLESWILFHHLINLEICSKEWDSKCAAKEAFFPISEDNIFVIGSSF